MDLNFDQMPFRCFPRDWDPEIRLLLATITEVLTPAQRVAFMLTDVKEKHGELQVCWALEGNCESLDPQVEAAIEAAIEAASRNVAALAQ